MTEPTAVPTVRFARTSDGLNIAFWTLGEGPALVQMPGFPVSHVRLEWQNAACQAYYRLLASGRTLVRYDPRGAGLSERIVEDLTIEGHVRDLEAVVAKAGIERFALLGPTHLGPAAITYAARHPERVTHLILWYTYARSADYSRSPRVEAARSLLEKDWELYTELEERRSAQPALGGYTQLLREANSAVGLRAAFAAIRTYDASDWLSQVTSPTLVLHRKDSRVLGVDVARELASRIPDSRLMLLEGGALAPFVGDVDAVIAAIDGFLSDSGRNENNPDGLTAREVEVLCLVAAARSNRQIAEDLALSERTVSRHITNVYTKIGAHSRAEATSYAIRHEIA